MRKRLIAALIVAAAASGGIAIVGGTLHGQAQDPNDFTIRVRRDVDLPHPLTTGEWRIEADAYLDALWLRSYQAEGRECFPSWQVPSGVSRMTVGPGNLDDICNGRAWLSWYGGDFRVRFTKLSGGGNPPPAGAYSDCVPQDVAFIFDWYEVKVCYETSDGRTGPGRPKSIGSKESGLIWFFNQDNIELLVKVLNGCRINGHRWIYVAPATDVAFNLQVEAQSTGEKWVLRNPQGAQTVAGDIQALQCVTAASSARTETVVRRLPPRRQ